MIIHVRHKYFCQAVHHLSTRAPSHSPVSMLTSPSPPPKKIKTHPPTLFLIGKVTHVTGLIHMTCNLFNGGTYPPSYLMEEVPFELELIVVNILRTWINKQNF